MRKLFVTGGAGFIGVNFVRYWRKHHPEDFIINFDALTYAGCRESQAELEDQDRYHFVQGNICDEALLHEIFTGVYESLPKPDLMVHFAAETHVDRSIRDSSPFVKTNVLGTQVLLEVALRYGKIRFHHVSTDEVFGSLGPEDAPFTESTPYAPRSPYAASKAASDHLVRSYYETYGLPVTISNCSNNYGSYQFPEKLLPFAITNVLREKKVPLYGTGQNIREWLHVEDHCRALELILLKGEIGETYCIGAEEYSNVEVIRALLSLMGKDESWIEYVSDRPGHDWRYALDCSKIRAELSWSPLIPFEQGLADTLRWYQDHENWWKEKIV
ncbi:MAG: dTDP-glucose 4,6-dehydratase [Candidatus Gracilibacteria bacterium]|nr:dTDP-glucose 4,6-dehydratase [bacterium]MDZ4217143.1 dTDP-glucose 4,6-dehydratase [Candidatus Gracilibacteria bacterium]